MGGLSWPFCKDIVLSVLNSKRAFCTSSYLFGSGRFFTTSFELGLVIFFFRALKQFTKIESFSHEEGYIAFPC